jgi:hypothetical protein
MGLAPQFNRRIRNDAESSFTGGRAEVTLPGGETVVRSGYTLTVLRKERDRQWVIVRGANLLAVEQSKRQL